MKVGFTGTRQGLTVEQHRALIDWFETHPEMQELHHGCCVGADAEASEIVGSSTKRIAHMPSNPALVSETEKMFADERRTPKPYLHRNKNIVEETDILLACPKEDGEQSKGGTWFTVRYARKVGKPVVIFWPDGSVTR